MTAPSGYRPGINHSESWCSFYHSTKCRRSSRPSTAAHVIKATGLYRDKHSHAGIQSQHLSTQQSGMLSRDNAILQHRPASMSIKVWRPVTAPVSPSTIRHSYCPAWWYWTFLTVSTAPPFDVEWLALSCICRPSFHHVTLSLCCTASEQSISTLLKRSNSALT